MSLKEKILEQAKSEFRCEKCLREIPSYQKKHFANGQVCNGQVVEHWRVSVDVVSGLLDTAIKEIKQKTVNILNQVDLESGLTIIEKGNVKRFLSYYVDDVVVLLDKAIAEIDRKAFRQGVGYWENAVMLADVRKILLGVVEAEKQK